MPPAVALPGRVPTTLRVLPPRPASDADTPGLPQAGYAEAADDARLAARARAGEREAFATLVARYYAPAWRFALRMLGDRSDAEDAVQETFFRAYANLSGYHERQQFRGWLFRILANQCRNAQTARRRRTRRFIADEAVLAAVPAPPPAPAGDPHGLGAAIARLDVRSREALLLRFGEGLEYAEMAAMTGVGESALKMRVKRACERLRRLLGDREAADRDAADR